METGPHRVLAVATVLAAAHTWELPPTQVGVMCAVAAATGGGILSPDIDNRKAAKTIDGIVPDEALGGGGPLGHRQITHWWGVACPARGMADVRPAPTGGCVVDAVGCRRRLGVACRW